MDDGCMHAIIIIFLPLDPPDQRSSEHTHNTIQQGHPDLQDDNNMDVHTDPPDQVQQKPPSQDDHQDDQGASSTRSLPSDGLRK